MGSGHCETGRTKRGASGEKQSPAGTCAVPGNTPAVLLLGLPPEWVWAPQAPGSVLPGNLGPFSVHCREAAWCVPGWYRHREAAAQRRDHRLTQRKTSVSKMTEIVLDPGILPASHSQEPTAPPKQQTQTPAGRGHQAAHTTGRLWGPSPPVPGWAGSRSHFQYHLLAISAPEPSKAH